jgi:hypothetical protein
LENHHFDFGDPCGGVATATVMDGAAEARVFLGFVEHFSVPTVRAGDIVVGNNLASHKVKRSPLKD